jgi:DNA-binding transcriptional LysR family regulator
VELGEKVYRRAGRKLVLTPAGRLTVGYSRRLILMHDEAIAAVRG